MDKRVRNKQRPSCSLCEILAQHHTRTVKFIRIECLLSRICRTLPPYKDGGDGGPARQCCRGAAVERRGFERTKLERFERGRSSRSTAKVVSSPKPGGRRRTGDGQGTMVRSIERVYKQFRGPRPYSPNEYKRRAYVSSIIMDRLRQKEHGAFTS